MNKDFAKLHLGAVYGLSVTRQAYSNRLQSVFHKFHVPPEKRGNDCQYDFYRDRLWSAINYGERSGMEIIKTVCRCAFADEVLTDAESISIINICHSPEWHKIFMEVNYNEGWN